MPPSILENIQSNYNLRSIDERTYDNDRYKYDVDRESLYSRKKDFQDNYGEYDTNCYKQNPQMNYGNDMSAQMVNQMRTFPGHEHPYSIYDKHSRTSYLGSKCESPYRSKERIPSDLYSPRDNHYMLHQSQPLYGHTDSVQGVHLLLKNDFQVKTLIKFRDNYFKRCIFFTFPVFY